jgi:hypothetical protein
VVVVPPPTSPGLRGGGGGCGKEGIRQSGIAVIVREISFVYFRKTINNKSILNNIKYVVIKLVH